MTARVLMNRTKGLGGWTWPIEARFRDLKLLSNTGIAHLKTELKHDLSLSDTQLYDPWGALRFPSCGPLKIGFGGTTYYVRVGAKEST